MSDTALTKLLSDVRHGVIATIGPTGRPQLSNVGHHYDADSRTIRISVTDDRVKVRNLRRDPRASYHVASANSWSWVVAEGRAELSPVATAPDDATVDALVDLYRTIAGEHPDWDDFREAMVRDRRLLLTIHVERLYGFGV